MCSHRLLPKSIDGKENCTVTVPKVATALFSRIPVEALGGWCDLTVSSRTPALVLCDGWLPVRGSLADATIKWFWINPGVRNSRFAGLKFSQQTVQAVFAFAAKKPPNTYLSMKWRYIFSIQLPVKFRYTVSFFLFSLEIFSLLLSCY